MLVICRQVRLIKPTMNMAPCSLHHQLVNYRVVLHLATATVAVMSHHCIITSKLNNYVVSRQPWLCKLYSLSQPITAIDRLMSLIQYRVAAFIDHNRMLTNLKATAIIRTAISNISSIRITVRPIIITTAISTMPFPIRTTKAIR